MGAPGNFGTYRNAFKILSNDYTITSDLLTGYLCPDQQPASKLYNDGFILSSPAHLTANPRATMLTFVQPVTSSAPGVYRRNP